MSSLSRLLSIYFHGHQWREHHVVLCLLCEVQSEATRVEPGSVEALFIWIIELVVFFRTHNTVLNLNIKAAG